MLIEIVILYGIIIVICYGVIIGYSNNSNGRILRLLPDVENKLLLCSNKSYKGCVWWLNLSYVLAFVSLHFYKTTLFK